MLGEDLLYIPEYKIRISDDPVTSGSRRISFCKFCELGFLHATYHLFEFYMVVISQNFKIIFIYNGPRATPSKITFRLHLLNSNCLYLISFICLPMHRGPTEFKTAFAKFQAGGARMNIPLGVNIPH